ncbi:MAG TPA: hypothetical protein VI758_13750 [Bacteroidota bacterium]
MIQQTIHRRRYTCGTHVSGRGRQIKALFSNTLPQGKERPINKGVIIAMPGKQGDPYTVLDEQLFIVLEAEEEHLKALS